MRQAKFFVLTFLITAVIISMDEGIVHLLLERESDHFISHLFSVIFLSLIAALISLLLLNRCEKSEKKKIDIEMREAKINQSIDAISKCQDLFGNFMNGLLLIELEAQEHGSVSKFTIEDLRKQMDEVNHNISILAEKYRLQ